MRLIGYKIDRWLEDTLLSQYNICREKYGACMKDGSKAGAKKHSGKHPAFFGREKDKGYS